MMIFAKLLRRRYRVIFACLLLVALSSARAAPDIEHWTTGNGARVYFVRAPELPMVDVRVVFDAGSAREAAAGGLAALTNTLLDEGAGDLDADAIAQRFEGVGASYRASSLRDMAVVHLRSLTDRELLDPALETFALVIGKPTIPQGAFERERGRMLVSVRLHEQSPGTVAEKAFYRGVYGEHPYAHPPSGTNETLQSLTREDVARFHKRYYVGRNAVIAIVGALERSEAEALAARITGGLPAGRAATPLPPVPPLKAAARVRREHPSAQTHVLVGQPGMRRGDPDYFPLYVGNHVLGGGGLVSRLNEEIREKRGLSYSVYSYFLPMARKGPYMMGLQTRNDQADAALKLLNRMVREFVEEGPTGEELIASKRNITGGFPLRIDSNKKIVEYIAMIGFYDLPPDYLETFSGKVEAVTPAHVRDAFRRRVDPGRMVSVIVGGPSGGSDSTPAAR